jgi:hypothetical protein
MGKLPLPQDRPDNLYEAVPADYGTHGRFDARSKAWSLQLWATTHRGLVAAGALAAGAVLWAGSRHLRAGLRR